MFFRLISPRPQSIRSPRHTGGRTRREPPPPPPPAALPAHRQSAVGKGCKTCTATGYKGRKGFFDYPRMSNPIRDMINAREPTLVIREKARELGMRTMREDAIRNVLDGYTTVDEVLRYP